MVLEKRDSAITGSASTEPGDEELLSQIRANNDPQLRRQLVDRLFTRYHRRVALWCLRITGDREAAADLAQEVLVKAYQGLDTYRGDARFSTWLYSITRNHCLNDARRRAMRPEGASDPLADDFPAQEEFESRFEREEQLRQMRELLQQLDETEQRVMVLHYREELPLDTITRLLGLSNSSGAKAYIVSARRKLKAAIERRKRTSPARRQ
jgi:RNA polymerase sigma-70 factor (ECF subfamily)